MHIFCWQALIGLWPHKKRSTSYLSTMHRDKQTHWARITFSVPSVYKPLSFLIHHGSMCAIKNYTNIASTPLTPNKFWLLVLAWYSNSVRPSRPHLYAGHAHTTFPSLRRHSFLAWRNFWLVFLVTHLLPYLYSLTEDDEDESWRQSEDEGADDEEARRSRPCDTCTLNCLPSASSSGHAATHTMTSRHVTK